MNIIASIILLIVSTEKWAKFIILFMTLWFVVMPIIKKLTKNSSKKRLIRICAGMLPLILCIVYVLKNVHPLTYNDFILSRGILCLVLLMQSITMFIPDSKKDKKFQISNVIKGVTAGGGIAAFFFGLIMLSQDNYVTDYSEPVFIDVSKEKKHEKSQSYIQQNEKKAHNLLTVCVKSSAMQKCVQQSSVLV